MKTILLIATLDTKGEEADYIRRAIERHGLEVTVLDPGMRITLLFDREAGRERGQTYVFATVGRYELLVR